MRRITPPQKSPASKKIESVRARLDRLGAEGDAARDAGEFKRRKSLFECVPYPPQTASSVNLISRTLEGIKDKLERLSERSTTSGRTENEGDMTTACDLADDLRDAIVEYQVRTDSERRTLDHLPIQLSVLPAGGNLWAKQ